MNPPDHPSRIDPELLNLFKVELENQTALLSSALLDLEQNGPVKDAFDVLLRAIHSIKGACRVVRLDAITKLTHLMEDVLVAAKKGAIALSGGGIDVLFRSIDFLEELSRQPGSTLAYRIAEESSLVRQIHEQLERLLAGDLVKEEQAVASIEKVNIKEVSAKQEESIASSHNGKEPDRVLRVTAENINRLMGLAGESLVESRWLLPFSDALVRIKKSIADVTMQMEACKGAVQQGASGETLTYALKNIVKKSDECKKLLGAKIVDLELFINRNSSIADRLYKEVVDSRMRYFEDGTRGFPRMVRDLARQLKKKVRLEIQGKSTPVDRDILEMLETPLAHLLRNAVDHGIELPEERVASGKPPEGVIRLVAEHNAGMLSITISDDGRGIDYDHLRNVVIARGMVDPSVAERLTEAELTDFLYLPGFSTREEISEISGRGVGLDIVRNMIQAVSGGIQTKSKLGIGTSINLQLPLTLSVIRALLFEVCREPYAIALNRIGRAVKLRHSDIERIEDRQYFHFEGKNVGLITMAQVLGYSENQEQGPELSVIVICDQSSIYGMIVDSFLGEKELVLEPIDPRLGKIQDIASGAIMEDGSPLLIVDTEDIVRTIEGLLSSGGIAKVSYRSETIEAKKGKRILVIDDSITVREVECRLLRNHGYEVESAVNGMEGWNAVRMGTYDLVVTDVDMPRMNGIELVRAIKADQRLKSIPVLIVSYKEREEDRVKGLEAGANYYLTKSGFHDQELLNAVVELIGKA